MVPEANEKHWERGHRAAFVSMLGECLRELGHDKDPAVAYARLVYEREQTLAKLRRLCDEHGDNEWENELHLSDIIEKHLVAPWEDRMEADALERKEEYSDDDG